MQEARAMAAEYFLWVGGWGRGGEGRGYKLCNLSALTGTLRTLINDGRRLTQRYSCHLTIIEEPKKQPKTTTTTKNKTKQTKM